MANSHATFAVRGVESADEISEMRDELQEFEGVQLVSFEGGDENVDVRYDEELIFEERIISTVRDAGYKLK